MKMTTNWVILFGLSIITSPFAQSSGLTPSKTVDTRADRRTNFEEIKNAVEEYSTPASDLGGMISGILSKVGVDNAVSISLTNNHPDTELTDPHWYIVDGKLDTPPPDVLETKQTMVITFERHPNSFWGFVTGSEGVLTYEMGNHYLLILWSAVPTKTNKFLVKIVNQDPNLGGSMSADDLFKRYKAEAWEAGDYGKWHSGINTGVKLMAAMGNGDKAPLQVFLSRP